MASSNSGGAAAVRGFLVQAVVALLDTVRADPPFIQITLEPATGDDQFDYLWTDANGSHATQVKSTANSFSMAEVERWAARLQKARSHESCRLILVGNVAPSLGRINHIGKVAIEKKTMNIPDLIDQASNAVARFLEDHDKPPGTVLERDRAVHAIIAKLLHLSAGSQSFSHADFVAQLSGWIGTLSITSAAHHLLEKNNALLRDALPSRLERYQKTLKAAYSIYDELGTPIGGDTHHRQSRAITIPDIFVAPGCALAGIPLEEFDAALLRNEQPAQAFLQQLEQCFTGPAPHRVVLLGDPGMGKSTLVKWLAVTPLLSDLERRNLGQGLPPSLRGCIPLPFIVRDLVRHLPAAAAEWDWEALKRAFRSFHATRHAGEPLLQAYAQDDAGFDALLQNPAALFLVDGLDEIGDPLKREAMRDALWQGFRSCPDARWILTSRRIGYDQAAVHREERVVPPVGGVHDSQPPPSPVIASLEHGDSVEGGPGSPHAWRRESAAVSASIVDIVCEQVDVTEHAHLLHLTPFDDKQQDDYARRWFSARLADVDAAQSTAQEFIREVRRSSHTRAISRVPNLLCLMAQLRLRHIPLPEGCTRLYETITLAYLKTIDEARGLGPEHHHQPPCEVHEAIRWLATIAIHLQVGRGRSATATAQALGFSGPSSENVAVISELAAWLRPEIARIYPGQEDEMLQQFLSYITQRSAFLLERGQGAYGFIHLSFQEYYAACWLELEFRRTNQAPLPHPLWTPAPLPSTPAIPMPETASLGWPEDRLSWPDLADTPLWCEPLVFLAETLNNEHDLATLFTYLFPLADATESPPWPLQAARLLASLSTSRQVRLTLDQRGILWGRLWQAWLAQPHFQHGTPRHRWHVARILLDDHTFLPQVHASLASQQTQDQEELSLVSCNGLHDLSLLTRFPRLRRLDLRLCYHLRDISHLSQVPHLESLHLSACFSLEDAAAVARLSWLTTLYLSRTAIQTLPSLHRLSRLQTLSLYDCARLRSLDPLVSLKTLQKLDLRACTSLTDFSPLEGLTSLTELDLQDCPGFSSLEPLGSLTALSTLNLRNSTGWNDLRPLSRLTALRSLDLSLCAFGGDLTPLAGLRELHTLHLNKTAVTDLRPLAGHPRLNVLELNETQVTDLSPLHAITTLRNLCLIRCAALPAAQIEELQAVLPDCMIFSNQDS